MTYLGPMQTHLDPNWSYYHEEGRGVVSEAVVAVGKGAGEGGAPRPHHLNEKINYPSVYKTSFPR